MLLSGRSLALQEQGPGLEIVITKRKRKRIMSLYPAEFLPPPNSTYIVNGSVDFKCIPSI